MIPAYKVVLFGSLGASMFMMGRLVLVGLGRMLQSARLTDCLQGHKTWFGKN